MTFRPLHHLTARIPLLLLPILLLLLLVSTPVAAAPPAKHPVKAAHAGSRSSRTKTRPGRPQVGSRHSSRSAASRGSKSRFAARHLVRVDPVSRLDTISTIATALSRGGSAISFPAALGRFYATLADHQQDPTAGTVRVLQFGDSHTAADMFTGEARRVLQRQFGNGSVGFTYPGHPFAGYRILGSQRSQSGGWQTLGTHFSDLGDTLLGMDGVAITTSRPGEFITLDAPCTSLQLDFLRQPGGGSFKITDDGAVIADLPTDAATIQPGIFHYTCPDSDLQTGEPDHHFVVTTTSSAPVRLFGLTTLEPGATWEALGINGAVAPLILRWDQALFTNYLHGTDAALVVLAYGTNEAAARSDPTTYSATFARIVDSIHTQLPGASILVLGPTDRAVSTRVGRRSHGFSPFSGTEPILEAQREVCRLHDCAFWNQDKRMGGLGSMQRWVYAGWAQPDHTHLTGEGYRALADALLADLLSGYDSYRKAHGLAITETTTHASPIHASTDASPSGAATTPGSTPATQQP